MAGDRCKGRHNHKIRGLVAVRGEGRHRRAAYLRLLLCLLQVLNIQWFSGGDSKRIHSRAGGFLYARGRYHRASVYLARPFIVDIFL